MPSNANKDKKIAKSLGIDKRCQSNEWLVQPITGYTGIWYMFPSNVHKMVLSSINGNSGSMN